jgi:hypothetical protein
MTMTVQHQIAVQLHQQEPEFEGTISIGGRSLVDSGPWTLEGPQRTGLELVIESEHLAAEQQMALTEMVGDAAGGSGGAAAAAEADERAGDGDADRFAPFRQNTPESLGLGVTVFTVAGGEEYPLPPPSPPPPSSPPILPPPPQVLPGSGTSSTPVE